MLKALTTNIKYMNEKLMVIELEFLVGLSSYKIYAFYNKKDFLGCVSNNWYKNLLKKYIRIKKYFIS